MTCCMAPGQFHRPPFLWPLVRWMETSSVLFICYSALLIGGQITGDCGFAFFIKVRQRLPLYPLSLHKIKDCRCGVLP